jgi:hypothetical protein
VDAHHEHRDPGHDRVENREDILSESTDRNQPNVWFQLAKMRLTSSNLPLVVPLMTRLDILGGEAYRQHLECLLKQITTGSSSCRARWIC